MARDQLAVSLNLGIFRTDNLWVWGSVPRALRARGSLAIIACGHQLVSKMPKTRRKSEEKRLFQKTRIQTMLDKSPWDSTRIFLFFCYFTVPSLNSSAFWKFSCSSLSPTLYKVETRKKILDTRVQHVIFCRRTLHLCNRYPFRLLVKSFSAVSERDIMIVKLLLYFLSVYVFFSFFMVSICFLFCFFVCLFVCLLLFLFSVSVKELIAVNSGSA